jgi:ACT domain-containing protein
MIVTMTLELSDEPGELLKALQPVADQGGNIVSVTHQRGEVTPRGTLPVEVTFEVVEERLQNVLDSLQEMGIRVAKFGEEKFHESMTVVLVGHLVRTDVTDTIKSVEDEGVKIVDFSLAMPDESEDTSSARLIVNATCQEKLEQAVESIEEVCDRKGLVKMQPIGVV